jgi:hypothetical protein
MNVKDKIAACRWFGESLLEIIICNRPDLRQTLQEFYDLPHMQTLLSIERIIEVVDKHWDDLPDDPTMTCFAAPCGEYPLVFSKFFLHGAELRYYRIPPLHWLQVLMSEDSDGRHLEINLKGGSTQKTLDLNLGLGEIFTLLADFQSGKTITGNN